MLKSIPRIGIVLGAIFLMVLLGAGEGLSDRIILENGDNLTGTVKDVIDGKLTLVTDYAGPIVLPVANIIDYQSDPEPGVDKTDVQWIGALQYSF